MPPTSEQTRTREHTENIRRILSLDGGGVRGLSSLMILQEIMEDIGAQTGSSTVPRPCEYFDLIGGTSTGGLIAIMLGLCGMSVDECITAYTELSKKVFKIDQVLANKIPLGDDCCRFDSEDLENVVKDIVQEKLGSPNCLLSEIPQRPYPVVCTFVVAKKALHADGPPTVFRSYSGDGIRPSKCAIWKAARATSAAPSYFKEMFVETPAPGINYVDGGLGHNNPSQVALDEARRIWPTMKHFGVLSIGTGRQKGVEILRTKSVEEIETQRSLFEKIRHVLPSIESIVPQWRTIKNFPAGVLAVIKMAHALTSLVTDSENVHQQLQSLSHGRRVETQFPYFRFNVDRDVGDIGLSDADPQSQERLAAHTHSYLLDYEIETKRTQCVDFLVNPPPAEYYQGPKSVRRILSLDGGGIKCLSSLMILDEIMKEIRHSTKKSEEVPRPCQYFDLICGTGFGGILAIMLGQLGMSVPECKEWCLYMMQATFSSSRSRAGSLLDTNVLKESLRRLITRICEDPNAPFDGLKRSSCPTFVVALNSNAISSPPTIIRSYDTEEQRKPRVTICQAALATSAAPIFFDPITIEALSGTFVAGSLGYNNPAELALAEASTLMKSDSERLCLVSLGPGQSAPIKIPDIAPRAPPKAGSSNLWLEFMTKFKDACVALTTDTEAVHQRISARTKAENENGLRYYRFNVERGMEDVKFHQFEKRELIESRTTVYLQDYAVRQNIRNSVKDILKARGK